MKEFKDTNQWAVILGGSSGLGLATAKKLAHHGLNICIIHRNSRSQEAHISKEFSKIETENIKLQSYNVDALRANKRTDLIEDLKKQWSPKDKIKVLVHSLAKGNLKPMLAQDQPTLKNDDFALTVNAMATSLYDWTQAIFSAQLFAEDSRIISFTSEGNTKAWPNYAAVSAAKAALEAITRNIALEFAPVGIKANCIQAGVTDTASLRLIPGHQSLIKHSLLRNPNKRLTLPEDIANAVYLLCKDEAQWITGTTIPVDGGEHLS